MATQQVKFHSVSTSQYNDVKRPIDPGSLYFISDNGEIRKGDKHITGTRVFTAEDAAGTTPVKDLDIKIDGKSIRVKVQKKDGDDKPLYKDASGNETIEETHTEGEGDDAHEVANEKIMVMTSDLDETVEHPKRGDMLIVNSDSANPSAYVYSKNGEPYDYTKWLACSGKYDASNVVITEDLIMAGTYSNVGNFKKDTDGQLVPGTSANGGTSGMTFQELLEKMFKNTIPPTYTRPSTSITVEYSSDGGVKWGSTTSYEVGTNVKGRYTVGYSDGYFTNQNKNGGTTKSGCVEGDRTITVDGSASSENTHTWDFVAGDVQSHTVTAQAEYAASTASGKDNLGNLDTSVKITEGTTDLQTKTVKISGVRYEFWNAIPFSQRIDILDPNFDISTVLTSDTVRTSTKINWKYGTSIPSKDTVIEWTTANAQLVFLRQATSANKTKKITTALSKSSNYASNVVGNAIECLKDADGNPKTVAVKGANGYAAADYYIWVIDLGADQIEGLKVTWA